MKFLSSFTLNILWLIVTLLLIIGVTQPMFTFTHFYFFDDTFSLASGIFHLLNQGEIILFGLLLCFSLLMPAVKMVLILYSINAPSLTKHQRYLHRLGMLGKWSMLDVFVIAILAVTIKISMVAEVTIHYGLIVFSVGVLMSMILPQLIRSPAKPATSHHITLSEQQLGQLNSQHVLTIEFGDVVASQELGDVFDHQQQWRAKVNLIPLADGKLSLALIAGDFRSTDR